VARDFPGRTLSTATEMPTAMTNTRAVRLTVARRPRLNEPHIAPRAAKCPSEVSRPTHPSRYILRIYISPTTTLESDILPLFPGRTRAVASRVTYGVAVVHA